MVSLLAWGGLADLPVQAVLPAAGAELAQLNPVWIVSPVLLRGVCALPALRTGHVYNHAVFLLCHLPLLQHLCQHAGAHSAPAFADRKANTFLQRDRLDQL